MRAACSHFKVPEDVLEHNNRVVDETGKNERHSAEHHGVDGIAKGIQDQKGGDTGDGDREQHGDRRAYVAQKQQDHDASQA